MANKFQKSVLERLEQEAVRQKQKSKIKAPEKRTEEKPVVQASEIEAVKTVPAVEPQEPVPEISTPLDQTQKRDLRILPDIGEYLRRDIQRLAKNKTFYLDNDVIEAIKTTAKAQQVTDSKLVNDILRRVLGLS